MGNHWHRVCLFCHCCGILLNPTPERRIKFMIIEAETFDDAERKRKRDRDARWEREDLEKHEAKLKVLPGILQKPIRRYDEKKAKRREKRKEQKRLDEQKEIEEKRKERREAGKGKGHVPVCYPCYEQYFTKVTEKVTLKMEGRVESGPKMGDRIPPQPKKKEEEVERRQEMLPPPKKEEEPKEKMKASCVPAKTMEKSEPKKEMEKKETPPPKAKASVPVTSSSPSNVVAMDPAAQRLKNVTLSVLSQIEEKIKRVEATLAPPDVDKDLSVALAKKMSGTTQQAFTNLSHALKLPPSKIAKGPFAEDPVKKVKQVTQYLVKVDLEAIGFVRTMTEHANKEQLLVIGRAVTALKSELGEF